jgi:hypothetical protein
MEKLIQGLKFSIYKNLPIVCFALRVYSFSLTPAVEILKSQNYELLFLIKKNHNFVTVVNYYAPHI